MNYADQPAFPDPMRGGEQTSFNQAPHSEPTGLTKREYMATKILAGLAANPQAWMEWDWDKMVARSVTIADNLLSQLNKPTNNKP